MDARVAAPTHERAVCARDVVGPLLRRHRAAHRDDRARLVGRGRIRGELERVVAQERERPRLAARACSHLDLARVRREHGHEADAVFPDLRRVVLLRGLEEGEQRPLDDRAPHALAVVVDRRDDRAARRPLQRHDDARRARVDAVLHELAQERVAVGELPHHVVDDARLGLEHGCFDATLAVRHGRRIPLRCRRVSGLTARGRESARPVRARGARATAGPRSWIGRRDRRPIRESRRWRRANTRRAHFRS